ncbi:MAG: hypothetical protein HY686_08340 [Chloroflexi bacterium]|nr:hypothetical protein [Chloroflexota bacterium]
MDDEKLKAAHEKAVACEFIQLHNRERGTAYRLERRGSPPEPDCICSDRKSNAPFGIEIGTVYRSDEEATGMWQVARGEAAGYSSPILVNPQEPFLVRLNGELTKKSRKTYQFTSGISGRLLLVVDCRDPLATEADNENLAKMVLLPKRHPYDEIWLGARIPWVNGYRFWRIYPSGMSEPPENSATVGQP